MGSQAGSGDPTDPTFSGPTEGPSRDDAPPFETILHYQIQGKLGEGGMGVVYKALDLKLNRLVALKFVPPRLHRSADALERFLQEANALSALNHPHIATIYDLATAEGQQFLVLEYLPGGTLKAKLQRARSAGEFLATQEILKFAQQTAEGLAHAHARGIIHRDVKTSNLMLTDEGSIKITDFGIAKLAKSSVETSPGTVLGTFAYMSPEQALGAEVDARTDVFSFGIVLFELLTGRLPFEAPSDAAMLTRVINARAPKVSDLRPDVHPDLTGIVDKALKKPVKDRCSMEELLADIQTLQGVRAGRTLTSSGRGMRAGLRGKQQRWIALALAVIVVAAVGVALFAGSRHVQKTQAAASARQLAVLPFSNRIGQDAGSESFCAGLAELLTSKLSQLTEFDGPLRVISAAEVIKEGVTGAKEAERVFGANAVIEGSVQSAGEKMIVTMTLVDTRTHLVLAAREAEALRLDLASLQELLIEKAADMLQMKVGPEARRVLSRGLPATPTAYDFYLQGLGYLQRYDRAENLENAIAVFQRALLHDANYALAYAGLAEAQLRRYQYVKDPRFAVEARKNALRAVELNDELAPAHFTLGMIQASAGEFDQAIKSLETAIQLQPSHADVYSRELANALDASGRTEEAEATYRRAIQLNQLSWPGYSDLGAFFAKHGRLNDALEAFKRVVELTPDNYRGYGNLGGVYLKLGNEAEAIAMLKKSLELKPNFQAYSNLGTVYLLQERYREASEMYRQATELNPTDPVIWGNLGSAYRWAGMQAEAAEAYRRALTENERQRAIAPKDPQLLSRRAFYLSALGDRQKALEAIAEALRADGRDGLILFQAAIVYEQSGARAKAIEALQAALRAGFPMHEIQHSPALAALRTDPRVRDSLQP